MSQFEDQKSQGRGLPRGNENRSDGPLPELPWPFKEFSGLLGLYLNHSKGVQLPVTNEDREFALSILASAEIELNEVSEPWKGVLPEGVAELRPLEVVKFSSPNRSDSLLVLSEVRDSRQSYVIDGLTISAHPLSQVFLSLRVSTDGSYPPLFEYLLTPPAFDEELKRFDGAIKEISNFGPDRESFRLALSENATQSYLTKRLLSLIRSRAGEHLDLQPTNLTVNAPHPLTRMIEVELENGSVVHYHLFHGRFSGRAVFELKPTAPAESAKTATEKTVTEKNATEKGATEKGATGLGAAAALTAPYLQRYGTLIDSANLESLAFRARERSRLLENFTNLTKRSPYLARMEPLADEILATVVNYTAELLAECKRGKGSELYVAECFNIGTHRRSSVRLIDSRLFAFNLYDFDPEVPSHFNCKDSGGRTLPRTGWAFAFELKTESDHWIVPFQGKPCLSGIGPVWGVVGLSESGKPCIAPFISRAALGDEVWRMGQAQFDPAGRGPLGSFILPQLLGSIRQRAYGLPRYFELYRELRVENLKSISFPDTARQGENLFSRTEQLRRGWCACQLDFTNGRQAYCTINLPRYGGFPQFSVRLQGERRV